MFGSQKEEVNKLPYYNPEEQIREIRRRLRFLEEYLGIGLVQPSEHYIELTPKRGKGR